MNPEPISLLHSYIGSLPNRMTSISSHHTIRLY